MQFIFVSKNYLNVQIFSAWRLVVNCVMKCKCCAVQRGLYPIQYMLLLYPFARFSFRLVYNFHQFPLLMFVTYSVSLSNMFSMQPLSILELMLALRELLCHMVHSCIIYLRVDELRLHED